ncbi:hypothetical protein GGF31_004874 [Allomyces arbusculus]|nr:hypothetical protein GGF31_004874 [Allomyces arbusculus]
MDLLQRNYPYRTPPSSSPLRPISAGKTRQVYPPPMPTRNPRRASLSPAQLNPAHVMSTTPTANVISQNAYSQLNFRASAVVVRLKATPTAWAPNKGAAKQLAAAGKLNYYRDASPTFLLAAYAATHGHAPPVYTERTAGTPLDPARPDLHCWYRASMTVSGKTVHANDLEPSVDAARDVVAAQWHTLHAHGRADQTGSGRIALLIPVFADYDAVMALHVRAYHRYHALPPYEFDERDAPSKDGKVLENRCAMQDAALVWLDQHCGDLEMEPQRRVPGVGEGAQGDGL